jgi:hypothetical protein
VADLVVEKQEDYMKALRKKGNMDSLGKKFAGVAGKSIEYIDSFLDEDDEPHVFIKFTDETALDITVGSNPNLGAEWQRVKDGELEAVRRKAFL